MPDKKNSIDTILKQITRKKNNGTEQQELLLELEKNLEHPKYLENSPILPTGHALKLGGQVLLDAFESITNGMHNPMAFKALNGLPEDHPYVSWKHLILALQAFYNGQNTRTQSELSKIDKDMPAARLVPLLKVLSGNCSTDILKSPAENELYDIITADKKYIGSIIEQLEDALTTDYDIFLETISLVIQDIQQSDAVASKRTALWAFSHAMKMDFPLEDIIHFLKRLYGEVEGLRLIAVAILQDDPDVSLLYWLRSLSTGLETKQLSQEKIVQYILIIGDICRQLTSEKKQDGEISPYLVPSIEKDNEYKFVLNGIINKLLGQLRGTIPDLPIRQHFGSVADGIGHILAIAVFMAPDRYVDFASKHSLFAASINTTDKIGTQTGSEEFYETQRSNRQSKWSSSQRREKEDPAQLELFP